MSKLKQISIQGYKSIKKLEKFELSNLNILLGANGAGKSNFISTFVLLTKMRGREFSQYVIINGSADAFLHYGRKKTNRMCFEFYFEDCEYKTNFIPTVDNNLFLNGEEFRFTGKLSAKDNEMSPTLKNIHQDSFDKVSFEYDKYILPAIENLRTYHFHDTSDSALVKQIHQKNDNLRLKPDAANLAPFLFKLKIKHSRNYNQIIKAIRLVAPFFNDFVHREDEENIQLEWIEVGNLDTPFKAHVLSDGTLRFICLATLLLQPFELMPDIVLIDEPELGLHPYALAVLADLIKRAAEQKQLIISTQSVELINHFPANDIIVVDRIDDSSTFNRLDEEKLKDWLGDYSLGDLWKQNIFGGRPSR